MSKKPSGLAAFTAKRSPAAPGSDAPAAAAPTDGKRQRGKAETVALTARLVRADWIRLHQLAISDGVSLQTLIVRGLNREMAAHGLPELES